MTDHQIISSDDLEIVELPPVSPSKPKAGGSSAHPLKSEIHVDENAGARGKCSDHNDGRPEIHLQANDIERIVNESEAALIAADRGIYQRDGKIVFINTVTRAAAKGVEVKVQNIAERGDHALREDMSSAASFQKYDARSKGMVATDPPMQIVQTLKQREGQRLRFPVLAGVINAPTMRPDGSIFAKPGYDVQTKLLFDPLGVEFPAIPERPTREDGIKALASLLRLLAEFPFVTAAHRSVALSAIITALVRRTLKSAPLHGFSATVAGSGKGMLVNLAGIIATGSEVPVTTQAGDEELENRLAASLFAGDQIISIDNCTKPLGGDLLCQIITEETVKPRILGESKNPTRSAGAFVVATGNNLKLAGDMTRRSLISRLDPQVERPELRNEFAIQDLLGFTKENRPALVVAVLTILRAYRVAGSPDAPPRLGSFGEWSDRVRGALMWLGKADPVETMEEIRGDDPELTALRAVATAWCDAFPGGQSVTVADVVKTAVEQQGGGFGGEAREFVNEDLREALMTVAGRGPSISGRELGRWLGNTKGRIVDGMHFERMGERRRVAVWRLVDKG
jgi:putative DNA primase/helicase